MWKKLGVWLLRTVVEQVVSEMRTRQAVTPTRQTKGRRKHGKR